MKKSYQIIVVLLGAFLFLSSCHTTKSSISTKKALLRLNLKKNDTFIVDTDMTMVMSGSPIDMNMNFVIGSKYIVNDVSKEQILSIGTVNSFIQMNMKMGEKTVLYDSRKPDLDNPEQKEMETNLRPILGVEFVAKVDNRSNIIEQPNYDVFNDNPKMKAQMENFAQSFKAMFIPLPEKAVKVGDSWDYTTTIAGVAPLNVNSVYIVTEITATEVKLDLSGTIQIERSPVISGGGIINGKMLMDRMTGMVKKSNGIQKLSMEASGIKMEILTKTNMSATKK